MVFLLTHEQQKKIAEAAFELLERISVKLTEWEAQSLLDRTGEKFVRCLNLYRCPSRQAGNKIRSKWDVDLHPRW